MKRSMMGKAIVSMAIGLMLALPVGAQMGGGMMGGQKGGDMQGDPVMPAWNGHLSDREIEDATAWFQAPWPVDVYDRWRRANAQPASPKG